jgi:hypothetical protein
MKAAPGHRLLPLALLAVPATVAAVVVAAVAGLVGATAPCLVGGGSASASGPRATGAASQFPPARLHIFMAAARRFDISWPFLASIGVQECGYDGHCGVAPSGCAGVMEMAYVRGSACSPDPSVPTLWEKYEVDADGGGASIFDPADAIFTGARVLRSTMGAPPAGGSFGAYHEAACNYYGACADGVADYADEVMARAVEFGFGHEEAGGSRRNVSARPGRAEAQGPSAAKEGPLCESGSALPSGRGPMGPVHRASAPRHLAPLPTPPASAPGIECDARIVPDVIYLARRFGLLVTACYGIHAPDGEHPLGAAIDAVPGDGDWSRTMRAALSIGWHPSCAASGVAPGCARPPFRFVGYNGYPDHGDPAHCSPCSGGAHLHVSWNTSASLGEPENRPRSTYEPAAWIEVFATGGADGEGEAAHDPGTSRRTRAGGNVPIAVTAGGSR